MQVVYLVMDDDYDCGATLHGDYVYLTKAEADAVVGEKPWMHVLEMMVYRGD